MDSETDAFLQAARMNLERDGHLIPTFILWTEDGVIFVDAHAVWTEGAKDRFTYMLGRTIGFGYDVKRFWAINDAYLKSIAVADDINSKEDTLPHRRLIDDPDAGECIIVSELWEDGTITGFILPYERDVSLGGTTFNFKDVTEMDTKTTRSYLFEQFWEGKQSAGVVLQRAYDNVGISDEFVFSDTGFTALETARRAARQAAITVFGADIMSISDLPEP